jgi:hypothetical protein
MVPAELGTHTEMVIGVPTLVNGLWATSGKAFTFKDNYKKNHYQNYHFHGKNAFFQSPRKT